MSHDSTNPLFQTLTAALCYVNETCVLGCSNKKTDVERTGEWSIFCGFVMRPPQFKKTNNKWRAMKCSTKDTYLKNGVVSKNKSEDPLMDPQFQLTDKHRRLLIEAMYTQIQRMGNCFEKATLLAKFLWENKKWINRIEVVSASNFDHVFVIVNRSGNIEYPETWGDAYIVDAWAYEKGIIYKASEFKTEIKKIKKYFLQEIHNPQEDFLDIDEETYCKVSFEIDTATHLYPSYSTTVSVESYYDLPMDLPYDAHSKSLFFSMPEDKELYSKKFSPCANEIIHFEWGNLRNRI